MLLRIEVTAEDIASGIKDDCEKCPIALAIRRACPSVGYIEVDGDANLDLDGVTHYARFPKDAWDFVENFDGVEEERTAPVEPFTFEAEFKPGVPYWSDHPIGDW